MNLDDPLIRHLYMLARKETITPQEFDGAVAAAKTFVTANFTSLGWEMKHIESQASLGPVSAYRNFGDLSSFLRQRVVGLMHSVWGMMVARDASRVRLVSATRTSEGRRVFVVHGHDHGALDQVVQFITSLGLDVCVLKDEPNKGRTIIEKFEQESGDAGFAVILCTPDDEGYARSDGADRARLRARQNVVLELGYFISKLRRSRVCALMVGELEMPSDVNGVLYTRFDSPSWRTELKREIEAAGLLLSV